MSWIASVREIIRRRTEPTTRPPQEQPVNDAVFDVTPFFDQIDLTSLEVIRQAPAWMTRGERLLLFALIFGLRPARYLEIGTFQGGSALIVAASMDASGSHGRIVCIDPKPEIKPEDWKRIEHRGTLLQARSPEILAHAVQVVGGMIDFALIDGDHTAAGVTRDAEGVLPFLAQGGYLLFHDAYFPQVGRALDDFAKRNPEQIIDLGCLTREVTLHTLPSSDIVTWGGLRLMRKK